MMTAAEQYMRGASARAESIERETATLRRFGGSFLTVKDEFRNFDTPTRRIARRVIDTTDPEAALEPMDLDAYVLGLVEEERSAARLDHPKAEAAGCLGLLLSLPAAFMDWFFGAPPPKYGPWTAACCIQVEKNDGMTWSAEAVRRAFLRHNGQFTGHTFSIRSAVQENQPPAVAELIGLGRLAWHATRRHLTDAFPLLRLFANPLAFLVIAMTATAASVGATWAAQAVGPASGGGQFIFAAVVGLIASVGLKSVVPELSVFNKRERVRKLASALSVVREGDDGYNGFIEDLARELAGAAFPRAVIIDRFESLDVVTQQVIIRYFEKYWTGGYGSELWVIFDSPDGPTFAAIAKSHYAQNGLTHFRVARQLLLERQERLQLAREVEHPQRAEFKTVKAIAHGEESVDASFVNAVRGYRRTRAGARRAYDALDILCVFGAAMASGPYELTAASALEAFRSTRDETNTLLRNLLPGTKHNAAEFGAAWASLHEHFGPFLRTDLKADPAESPKQRSIWLSQERALWLLRHGHELDAPEAKLIHAFWGAHFYATRQKAANEAFWVRKIADHLTRSDASSVGNREVAGSISAYLLTASLWTLRQCLRLCIAAPVADLLEFAAAVAADTKRTQRELVTLAWEAYDVTADEDALAVALNAEPAMQRNETDDELGPLHQLFFDALPLGGEVRSRVSPRVFESAAALGKRGSKRRREERLSDYATARAAWLACAAIRVANRTLTDPQSTFGRAVLEWCENATTLVERTAARLSSGHQATPEMLDVATVSNALWAVALASSHEVAAMAVRHRINTNLKTVEWEHARFNAALHVSGIRFPTVLALAETAVELARTLNHRYEAARANRAPVDLLAAAYAREIAFEALGALWVSGYFARGAEAAPSAEEHARAGALAATVEQELGVTVRAADRSFLYSAEAQSNLLRGLSMCGALWRAMGMAHFDELLSVRRVELMALAGDILKDDRLLSRITSASIAASSRRSYTGVLANLTMATAVRSSREFASTFVTEAAEIGAEGSLGSALQQTLVAHIAVDSYNLDPRGARLVVNSVTDSFPGADSLLKLLTRLPIQELPGAVLSLTAAASHTRPGQKAALQLVRDLLPLIAHAETRHTVRDIADAAEVRWALERGDAVDPQAVLADWAWRRDSFSYAAVLSALIRRGRVSSDILSEAGALLSRDPSADVYNGWINLAVAAGLHLLRTHVRDAVFENSTRYLRASIGNWADSQAIDWSISAYRLLLADGISGYEEKLEALESRKIHLYHARRVPHLLERDLYFNIFVDYFDSMRDRGVEVTIDDGKLAVARSASDDVARECIQTWLGGGAEIPPPLRPGFVVSSDFIILGEYIQRDLGLDEGQVARARDAFNRVARRNLPPLVEGIVALLPPAIAGVFQLHAGQITMWYGRAVT